MKYFFAALVCLFTLPLFAQSPRFVYPLADCEEVRKVTFSPDNEFIMSRTYDVLNIWNVLSGKLLYTLSISGLSNAEFIAKGKFVVSFYESSIVILELKTGKKFTIEPNLDKGRDARVIKLIVSPSERLIAVGNTFDTTFKICTDLDKKFLQTYKGNIEHVAFTTDEKYMITGYLDGQSAGYHEKIMKWDLKNNQLIKAITIDAPWWASGISPDGETIATHKNDTMFLWNFKTDKPRWFLNEYKKDISYLNFSQNGKSITVYSKDSIAIEMDVTSGKMIKKYNYISSGYKSISMPDGRKKAVYGDSSILLYDIATGKLLDSVKINLKYGYNSPISSMTPDGNYISWGDDEQFYVYSTQKKEVTAFRTHPAKILDVIFSPDNKYFLTNNHDRATLWDPLTAKPVVTMKSNRDGIECAFNEEGTRLMTWDGRDLNLWSIPDGKKLAFINNARREEIYQPFISKDGNKIGIVSHNEISIWKDSFQKAVHIIDRVSSTVKHSPVFNKDGKFLLTANKDSVLLYLADSGIVLKSFKRNTVDSPYMYVYISPDDKYIMTHDIKHSQATVWDRVSGKKLYNLNQNNPQFTNNAKFILSGQTVYDVATGKELETSEGVTLKYPLLNPFADKYITKFTNEDIIKKKMFQIKDAKTGKAYTMLVLAKNNYLVFDEHGRFDGTPEARNLLLVACGSKIMEQRLGLDKLWVPGLAEKIMKGETISGSKLAELTICK